MAVLEFPVKEASRNLDFDNAKMFSVGEAEWLQIPIPTEGIPQEGVVRFPNIELNDSPMSPPGAVSTYLIVQNRKKGVSSKRSIIKVETYINGERDQRGRIPDGINPQDEVLVTVRFFRNSFLKGDRNVSGMAYVVEDRRDETE